MQVDKCLKLEQPSGVDLKSTDTRSIKATKLALDCIRANKIAIKNSKTSKVTAVVAILKVFGDKCKSRNSNLRKLLSKPNKWLNSKKKDLNRSTKHLNGLSKPISNVSKRLIVKQKIIRVLLDTGSSGDLLFIKKWSQKYIPTMKRAVPQSWGTSNGTFQTKKVGTIDISLMEYSTIKSVCLTPDIVEYEVGAPSPLYDLIIGKQTLHNIVAVLDFKEKTNTIDSILLPMRNIVNLQLKPSVTKALRHNTVQAKEPVSTRKATKMVIEKLDAKYDKANLPEIVKDNCSHLEPSQREKLLSLLLDYKSLFDGTLGDWNRPPVLVEIKEGAKPYHGRPYPTPQIHKATLMKEINRLERIGVLKRQSSSQWASPTFIIPKKDITVRTITNFRELNIRIIRRPYLIPKISTTLQKLEGFTYAMTLDLNMGYYTIRLNPRAVEMLTIIFPWGK